MALGGACALLACVRVPQGRRSEFYRGVGPRRRLPPDWAWQVGTRRSSVKRDSANGLHGLTPSLQAGRWSAGISVGAVVGSYQGRYKSAVRLHGQWKHGHWGSALGVFPSPPPDRSPKLPGDTVTAPELSWRLL